MADIVLPVRARDEASAVFAKIGNSASVLFEKLGSEGRGGRPFAAALRGFDADAFAKIAGTLGAIRVGAAAMDVATRSIESGWSGVAEQLGSLPLGIGEAVRATSDLALAVSGIKKTYAEMHEIQMQRIAAIDKELAIGKATIDVYERLAALRATGAVLDTRDPIERLRVQRRQAEHEASVQRDADLAKGVAPEAADSAMWQALHNIAADFGQRIKAAQDEKQQQDREMFRAQIGSGALRSLLPSLTMRGTPLADFADQLDMYRDLQRRRREIVEDLAESRVSTPRGRSLFSDDAPAVEGRFLRGGLDATDSVARNTDTMTRQQERMLQALESIDRQLQRMEPLGVMNLTG